MKWRSLADFVTNRIKYPPAFYLQNNARLRYDELSIHHCGQFRELVILLINRLINFFSAMTTTPITSKGEQAKSQLIAAAIAQFGEYGQHATTRDIAAQAGQNIAAITYYFGSKDDLYLACAQWIADFIGNNFRPHAQAAEELLAQPAADKAAMRTLILRACQNMILLLTQEDTVNLSKFISREQLSPTPAYQLIHDQVIAPLHCHLTRLIAAYTGLNADSTQMILHTHALLGEVLAFRLVRETVLRRAGWAEFDQEKTEQIIQVITCHVDFVLQGLSQRSLES